jgi:translation elongation factor EF-Ts
MRSLSKSAAMIGLAGLALGLFLLAPACKKQSSADPTAIEQEMQEEAPAEEAAPKPAAPAPKIDDNKYVEFTARAALIHQKYADDPAAAEKEIEALYDKLGFVFNDYREFQAKLTPAKSAELQKRVQEFMQKILHEYR